MTRGGATPPICWVGCGALGYRLEDLREAEWDAGLGNGGVWVTIRQYAERSGGLSPSRWSRAADGRCPSRTRGPGPRRASGP
jgi:hypothetical protein